MSEPEKLSAVRCFLLDMDGTFYLGDRLLEGALRFIELLRAQGKEFLFLTNNSSKQGRQYAEKITRLGLPLPEELVLTSGEATALYLKDKHQGARLLHARDAGARRRAATTRLQDGAGGSGFHRPGLRHKP